MRGGAAPDEVKAARRAMAAARPRGYHRAPRRTGEELAVGLEAARRIRERLGRAGAEGG